MWVQCHWRHDEDFVMPIASARCQGAPRFPVLLRDEGPLGDPIAAFLLRKEARGGKRQRRPSPDLPGPPASQRVGGRPNSGNSAAPNVVISATNPASKRTTSILNARYVSSPGASR